MRIKSILAQLQQRRVTRVALIYSGIAWGLLQVADVLFPIVGLSENAITMVLLLALVGFPVALVLSWVFDITATGITPAAEAEAAADTFRFTPTRILAIAAGSGLILLVGYLYLERLGEKSLSLFDDERSSATQAASASELRRPIPGGGRPTIAVLPFANLSDSPDMEHFGDGLAEEILNLLARLNELGVAARTSSFHFKGRNLDVQTIAGHLGVRYVLEGSVRQWGDQVRVTTQLVDAKDGFHLWSETYDRQPANVFTVQDDISREVVKQLQLVLSAESQQALEREVRVDARTYDYYLRGRDYLRQPGDASTLRHARDMFEKAIARSGDFADAFAGLCDTLLYQYSMNFEKAKYAEAENACQRAQSLDSRSVAVRIALGNLYRESGQFALAEREFDHALALQPTAVDAHIGLAETFVDEEKYTLAERTLDRALELEPNNWSASMAMGRYLFTVGRVGEAVPYFERIDELMPESNAAATNLGSAYFLLGRYEDAASAWESALHGAPSATLYSNLGSSYFFLGRFDRAAQTYEKALALAPDSFESWGNLADAYRHSPTQSVRAAAAYERAITLTRQHLQINPSDALALAALGHYLACTGQREQALESIALAQQLAQKDMYVYYFSATAFCALNEPEKALDAIHDAVALGYPRHMVEVDAGLSGLQDLPAYDAIMSERSH